MNELKLDEIRNNENLNLEILNNFLNDLEELQDSNKEKYYVIKDKLNNIEIIRAKKGKKLCEKKYEIKKELSVSIENIKFLLENTNFILSKTTVYPFQKENNNPFYRFIEYKLNETSSLYGMDCDVNLYNIVLYCLLNNSLNFDDIENQDYTLNDIKKYKIVNHNDIFKGETLTSTLRPLKQYLGYLWEKTNNNNFKNLFIGVNDITNNTRIPTELSKNITWERYVFDNRHSEIIWNSLDDNVKFYLTVHQMFGNFMCIPGSSYNGESFNNSRSGKYARFDTVDALLASLYSYCKSKDDKYLYILFGGKGKEEIVEDTKRWLLSFSYNGELNWKDFVEKNCLRAFVDKDLKPISMKTGQAIPDDILEKGTYYCKLESYEESLVFFEQLSKRIVWRTIDIYKKVRE